MKHNNDPETQETLDHAARCWQTIHHSTSVMLSLVEAFRKGLPESQRIAFAEHFALMVEASGSAQQALIYGLGATNPGLRVKRDELRLDQLDTPATRNLLEALQHALYCARAVDGERGWVDEAGEAIGWAETIAGWELGLRREVEGAKGGGRG